MLRVLYMLPARRVESDVSDDSVVDSARFTFELKSR